MQNNSENFFYSDDTAAFYGDKGIGLKLRSMFAFESI